MPKCEKCGNSFFVGSMISNYCRTCLEEFPELKTRACSCALPKCIYYKSFGKISLRNTLTPFGNYDQGSHCELLKKRITIPIINCEHHKTE
jgi:hypothetical protein